MRSFFAFKRIFPPYRSFNIASFSAIEQKGARNPQSSFKRKIVFNWDNVKNLRGHEKLELFRDFAQTADAENSLRIYLILKENDLLSRLTYVDHHKMFHLLLQNRRLYRTEIINVWNWLKENKYYPSAGLYKEMFFCYKAWMDLQNAIVLYQEIMDTKIKIAPEIYETLLTMYATSRDSRNHLEGIKLWNTIEKFKSRISFITIALELFGKVKDTVNAANLYHEASLKLPKEGVDALKIKSVYLSALVHAEAYDEALKIYESMINNSEWIAGSQVIPTGIFRSIFRTMIKATYKTNNLQLAKKILSDMESKGIAPDSQINSRFLVMLGASGDLSVAETFYKTQISEALGKDAGRYQVALLEVYCLRLERTKADEHFALIKEMPFKLYAMNFLQKMYQKLEDVEAVNRMAEMIKLIEEKKES